MLFDWLVIGQVMIDRAIRPGVFHDSDGVIGAALAMLTEDIECRTVSEARANEPLLTLAEVEDELRAIGKLE